MSLTGTPPGTVVAPPRHRRDGAPTLGAGYPVPTPPVAGGSAGRPGPGEDSDPQSYPTGDAEAAGLLLACGTPKPRGAQMTTGTTPETAPVAAGSKRLMVLLAMAMFVLVVDTSLMNVSISAVIDDLDTTASGVQSAIALEALVSAAFILINSKVGDLIGRKRAYVLGPARLRRRGAGHDPDPEPDGDHHLLGGHRRARGVAAAAGDAVADPRQLRRRRAEAGLRPGRRRGRHRRRGRPAARRLRHDLPVVAGRLRARGRHHRRRAEPDPAGAGRRRTPARARSTRSARCCPSSAWAASCSASSSGRRAASSSCCSWWSARSRWCRWPAGWCAASARAR